MWGWLPGRVLSGSLNGSGPAGGCSSRKAGWLTVSREACFSRVGLVAWCVWCKTRPLWWAAGAVVVVVVCWWWVPSRAWCAWGWHAVGVLGQCALVAWPVFCCLVWVVGCGCGWVGCELYSGREHLTVRFLRQIVCFVRVSLLFVFLSVRWMPWHQGPMKDVVACDIPRGAGWRAVIRGFPNGGTRHELCRVTCI